MTPMDAVSGPRIAPAPARPTPWTTVGDFAIVRRMGAPRARLRLLSSATTLALGLLFAPGCDKLSGGEEKKDGDASAKTAEDEAM